MRNRAEEAKLIEYMLAEVEHYYTSDGQNVPSFIESVREQFDEFGGLSKNQIEAIRKWYDRVTG